MNRFRLLIAIIGMTVALTGCVGLPTYVPAPGEALTKIKLSPNMGDGPIGMCTSKGEYTVRATNGYAQLPANQRIRIWRNFVTSGYRVIYSCAPGVSFDAYPNVTYYADFEVRAEKCGLNVYRMDSTSRAGLALDPTVGRDMCPATK